MNARRITTKIIVGLALAGIALYALCPRRLKEYHILKNGYVGKVWIIFNQSDGQPEEYYNDYRVYRIPANGILRTQFKSYDGYSELYDLLLFYERSDKRLDTIYYLPAINNDIDTGRTGFVVGGFILRDTNIWFNNTCSYYVGTNKTYAHYLSSFKKNPFGMELHPSYNEVYQK